MGARSKDEKGLVWGWLGLAGWPETADLSPPIASGRGLDSWRDLRKASTAYVSAGGVYSFYAWMPLRRQHEGQRNDRERANPDMTDGQIAYSIEKLKQFGIVDSGDALHLGIGAMTDERLKAFFDEMVRAGVIEPDVDDKRSSTLQFVDKGVGVAPAPK